MRSRTLVALAFAGALGAPAAVAAQQADTTDKPVTPAQVAKNVGAESKRVANRTGKVVRKAGTQTAKQGQRTAKAAKRVVSRKARQEARGDTAARKPE